MNIQDKLRASDLRRWHTVAVAKEQSLAEHTFNVMVIAKEFCLRRFPTDKVLRMTCIDIALEHDLDEVFYGDVPSQSKAPRGWDWSGEIGPEEIVKIADLIDQYTFIYQHKVDRYGQQASQYCAKITFAAISQLEKPNSKVYSQILEDILDGEFQI